MDKKEFIDVYDINRENTEKVIDRYNYKFLPNEFSLSVQIWIINDKDEIILTKRSSNKYTYPNYWECTEGAVDSGESSLESAIREVKEELGIDIYPNEIYKLKIDKNSEKPKFTDVFVCKKNIDIHDIKLQEEECSCVKLVNEEEYNKMIENSEIIPYLNYFYDIYKRNINSGIIDAQNITFITNKKMLKGNLHTHSTYSDGIYNVDELINIYENRGYDFLGITDHDKYFNNNNNSNSNVILLNGIEATCLYNGNDKTKGEYAHFSCFCQKNNNYYIGSYKNSDDLNKYISDLKLRFELIQFNHPLFSRLDDNEMKMLNGYEIIEIYNHKDNLEESGFENANYIVRKLLNNNKKILVSAGDDFHGPYNNVDNDKCFGGFIYLDSKKDKLSIINSLKKGKFYASTGPVIYEYKITGRKIKVLTSNVKEIIFYTNLRKCKKVYDYNSNPINNANYILTGEEYYVWTIIKDFNGKYAWTQPIYIDNSPYFNK